MEEKNANLDFNLLDASDKRCSSVAFIVIICSHIVMSMFSSCLLNMQIKKQFTHGFEIVSKRVWFSTRFSLGF